MKPHRLLPAACCLLAGLWAAPVLAQCENGVCRPGVRPPATTPHPSVVRVMNAAGGNRYYGTGTLVQVDGGQSVVLTCAHLFPRGSGSVTVTFADGRRLEAQVLAVDPPWDLAALTIAGTEANAVAIAMEHPQPGEPLTSCGYGPDGRYWCNQGRALGYVRTGTSNSYETLELSGTAREGDSGGLEVIEPRGRFPFCWPRRNRPRTSTCRFLVTPPLVTCRSVRHLKRTSQPSSLSASLTTCLSSMTAGSSASLSW